MVNLTEYENRVLNIIKAKFGFKNKSEAIKLIIRKYESEFLEPELRPEFIEKMTTRENETVVQVTDFRSHFGLDENV
jgi:mannitol/fructose-specific phosphotransferase system IIA component